MAIKIRSVWRQTLYVFYVAGISILFLEILLRLYYPFQRKMRGDKWQLSTNVTYHMKNDLNPRLDSVVVNRRNSIGFRGEEPPADINDRFTILTVGGSTTACNFLNEGKTWTDRLAVKLKSRFPDVWVNNAGIDGNSIYGHLNFINHYLLKLSFTPKIILFLVGVNDVDRKDLLSIDSLGGGQVSVKRWLMQHSETVNFIRDLKWATNGVTIYNDKNGWDFNDFQSCYLNKSYLDSAVNMQDSLLPAFRDRLYQLIILCKKNNIQPIFLTQPLVVGSGNSAIDFHKFGEDENGQLFWMKLERYNNVTRDVCAERQVPCIDLAALMPKDTLYYCDIMHYTNAGAQKVSNIIYTELDNYLSSIKAIN